MFRRFIIELVFYLLFYGLLLLTIPFIFMLFLGVVYIPVTLLTNIFPAVLLLLILRIIFIFLIFAIYYVLTKKLILSFNKVRIWLFIPIFFTSVVIKYFFTLFSCQFSAFTPCDFKDYLNLLGFVRMFSIHLIALVVYILTIVLVLKKIKIKLF